MSEGTAVAKEPAPASHDRVSRSDRYSTTAMTAHVSAVDNPTHIPSPRIHDILPRGNVVIQRRTGAKLR
ncbi:hypothetical protein GCM10010405_50090 [Streptomyces macrosporus]|uniref:Uncharacterized protein n=1 Tax=Streptomyces macrosporus TaxID=44032 RepID=A0ABN3KHI7_9ACTN